MDGGQAFSEFLSLVGELVRFTERTTIVCQEMKRLSLDHYFEKIEERSRDVVAFLDEILQSV